MTKSPSLTGFAEAPVAVAELGLALLRSEMELLRAVLPGAEPAPEDEASRLRHEADVEEAFDNMPV